MAVLVTAIHDFGKDVDARNKSGHDVKMDYRLGGTVP
jgi:hypothetical protein